ncbi:orotidine-5'-phosphate decarboxylase [Candidatus Pantoea carbekii]|uniref:Orotidine 5'-phosphate decarboxylase n=1 Tax=Candidatus Pantoea carbekii TaxID=1235990 RepID=U3U366_9GAMM|nr:orotidine-5'-phosphate decarboxylase [Candidatus Pantoea carbekii]AKC32075.1 orotidine 5-phosphate decarboxylase PyrF [Candidatus Pantoea carbekii]BAO00601.1 PyrF protein [Candidatus Pantoea carbekii]
MVSITSPVVVALDYNSLNEALQFVDRIDPTQCRLKVGKEMFTLFGPSLIKMLHDRHFQVFLDLKFYDIPNTTARSISAAANLGVWMLSTHASGGARMLDAACEALVPFGNDAPLLIGVTVLTSINVEDLQRIGIKLTPMQQAERLACLAYECGLDGIVCSANEAAHFKKQISQNFLLVTPGIRLCTNNIQDQRRIMTPYQAKLAGVDYMVIGRPITQSSNPVAMLEYILHSLTQC